MARDVRDLSPKQQRTIVELVQGSTVEAAARSSGVSVRQLHRWMKQNAFREGLDDARRKSFDTALLTIQTASGKAVERLVKNLDCPSPAAQNAAAIAIISMSFKAREQGELRDRLAQLEAVVEESQKLSRANQWD